MEAPGPDGGDRARRAAEAAARRQRLLQRGAERLSRITSGGPAPPPAPPRGEARASPGPSTSLSGSHSEPTPVEVKPEAVQKDGLTLDRSREIL